MPKPELPDTIRWPDVTLQWYKTWKQSSHTDNWTDEQWQYMFDTALVHANVWGANKLSMCGELRTRLAFMGLVFDTEEASIKRKETTIDRIICRTQKQRNTDRVPRATHKKGT